MANGRIWTEEELDHLERWAGQKSLVLIGKQINRTPAACKQKLHRMGLTTADTTEYMTIAAVAEVAGCSAKKVQRLALAGKLRAKKFSGRSRGRSGKWLVLPDDIGVCKELVNHRVVGADNGRAKLTDRDVRCMKALREQGWSYPRIGREFQVTHKTAENAIKGKSWQHLKPKEWWERSVRTN